MVATLHPNLRELVLSNLKNLKGKLNSNGKAYKISKQLPDQWVEENRKLKEDLYKAKKRNSEKSDDEQQDTIEIRNRTLYVNKEPVKTSYLKPPSTADLFQEKTEQDRLDKIKYSVSAVQEERGSKFSSYALRVQSLSEVKWAYVHLRQVHPSASHIVAAYSIKNGEGYADDREYAAGHRILNILNTNGHGNTAAFVVRYHDGINLGPRRHILMQKVVTEALSRIKNLQLPVTT